MFEEIGGGGSDKKKKWIMIGIGTGLIAIFLVIKRSMAASQAAAAAAASSTPAQAVTSIGDTGSYPADMTGGISGTGMDQTMATYLAIADQNTSVQMGAVSDQLKAIQDQMNTSNAALQAQIAAKNAQSTVTQAQAAPQPPVTTTPATTSHPDPTSYTYTVKKGDNLYELAKAQYGSAHAAMTGGIQTIARANNLANPNRIYAGQTITIPTKIS